MGMNDINSLSHTKCLLKQKEKSLTTIRRLFKPLITYTTTKFRYIFIFQ